MVPLRIVWLTYVFFIFLSFGDSTAQPPTPKQTPTSTTSFFSSPIFETPKIGYSNASNTTTTPGPDWTPRFADEFSVFNNTPDNPRGSQGSLADFVAPFGSPPLLEHQLQPAASPLASKHLKRPLSVGNIAVEITSHVDQFTANTNLPLPPVEPSRRLSSSPGSLVIAAFQSTQDENDGNPEYSPGFSGPAHSWDNRAAKKVRNDSSAFGNSLPASAKATLSQSQTATPPPSAKKGGRKLAPKLKTATMQNDQGYGPQHQVHPDGLNTPQQAHMATFVTSPADLFGYPLSAPAAASAFADARAFWGGGEPNIVAMDVDYAAASAHIFNTPTSAHRQLDSIDWTQASQANQAYMISGVGSMPQQTPQHHLEGHHLHQMPMTTDSDPKQMMPPHIDTTSADHQALYAGSYPTPVDNPFGIMSPNGGVDPGLLFSRPPSSGMDVMASAPPGASSVLAMADSAAFDTQSQMPSSSAPAALQITRSSPQQPLLAMAPDSAQKGLRRTSSAREIVPRRKAGDRISASSPVKANMRPGLSRSFSENRGSGLRGRASLPTLAPAIKAPPVSSAQGPSFSNAGTGLGITRSASFGGSRPTGRSPPIRMHQRQQLQQLQQQQQQDQQHKRLSSLTSIPEVNTPQSRTSVKFTIDANGRARVETTVDPDDRPTPPSTLRRNQSARSLQSKSKWDSSSEDESSSTDDEPIIIPSRPTSFALPDPVKPSISRRPLHSSQRSVSDRSTASTGATIPGDASYNDPESEAETVMNEVQKGAGDAASELQKLRQQRQKQANSGNGMFSASSSSNDIFGSAQRGLQFGGPLGGSNVFHSGGGLHSRQAASPTTLTDASLPTPPTGSRSHRIRCVCGRRDAPPASDGFIVQW